MRVFPISAAVLILAGCGSAPPPQKTAEPAKAVERKTPPDESRRFPKANLTRTEVVIDPVWGKPFMPGGTVAEYQKGSAKYQMFVAKLPSASEAAFLLLDWKKAMPDAKLVPSFGGYFGHDSGTPVFVFPKGEWLAGIRGLNEKDSNLQARYLAAQLN
jgi:hypothetical protein